MSPSPSRRHRLRVSLATAMVGLVLLAGCAGQQTPDGYSDSVEKNFLAGCTTTAKDDGAQPAVDVAKFCGCVYDHLSGDGDLAVDFDEFKDVNSDQIEEPSRLPASFTKVTERCLDDQGESAVSGTRSDGGTTSTPAG